MKKVFLLIACASMMMSAVAQKQLVEDVQKKLSGIGTDEQVYKTLIDQITPALSNSETKNDALTWVTAGKAGFTLYDKNYENKLLGKEMNEAAAYSALLDAFGYYTKALPLDSVVEVNKDGTPKIDKKTGEPKFKTKYSKEIQETIYGHMNDFGSAGDYFRDNQNYALGSKAYSVFYEVSNSEYGKQKNGGVALPDTILGQIRFLQGFCDYFGQDYNNALKNFTTARDLNYTQNSIGDFWNAAFAYKVQGDLDKKDYAKALTTIDGALERYPNSGLVLDMKGIILEEQEIENSGDKADIEASLPYYIKATEAEPDFAQAFYHAGRVLYLRAGKIIDANPDLSNDQLAPQVNPICQEAASYLEKAYSLSKAQGQPDNQSKHLLVNIYYQLGEEAKAKALEDE